MLLQIVKSQNWGVSTYQCLGADRLARAGIALYFSEMLRVANNPEPMPMSKSA